MDWNLQEAVSYYRTQGAPGDQSALVSLLREVQQESGGRLPQGLLPEIAQGLGTKESYLQPWNLRNHSIFMQFFTNTLDIMRFLLYNNI